MRGRVLVDDTDIGTFSIDGLGDISMHLNGGRWTTDEVFGWALRDKKRIELIPQPKEVEWPTT